MKFSHYQENIFSEVITTNKNIAIQATAGAGKCLKFDTPVLMFSGEIKKVQDVKQGDQLMGPDSMPRNVLSTVMGEDEMYDVIPVKGDIWGCNKSHILSLKASYSESGINKNDTIDIPLNDWLLVPKWQRHQFKQFRVGVEFAKQKTNIDPYLLGVWIGDGTKHNGTPTVSINAKDIELISYLKNIKEEGIEVKMVSDNDRDSCYRISLTTQNSGKRSGRNKFRNEFLRCLSDKEVFIPKEYLINSRKNRLQLLAGLLDTDGHYSRGYYEISTKFDVLKNDILFLARSLGFYSNYTYKKSTIKDSNFIGYYWRISICGNVHEIPCKIKRKKAKIRKQKKDVLNTGFSIEYKGIGNYYGFEIDGDGRFLLGDFTVTHNTTVLVEISKLIPYGKRGLFVAFNKHIVNELKERLENSFECSTMHSIGFGAIRKHYPGNVTLKENKQIDFILPLLEREKNNRKKWSTIYEVDRVMKLARATMTKPEKEEVEKLLENYAIDLEEEQISIMIRAIKNFYKYNDTNDYSLNVDFQDFIEMPVRNKEIRMPQYDYLAIDEAQDMSKLDQLFLNRLVKPMTGRNILVGDPRQSIYAFRGSDVNSFDSFASQPNTVTLPLSISYRCAKNIVKEAQKVYKEIEENPEGKEGIVRKGKLEEAQDGDFVLCRNTRPLVDAFMQLIKMGKKAYIVGKELEKGLLALLVNCPDTEDKEEIELYFQQILVKKIENISKKTGKKLINPKNHPQYAIILEKIEILRMLFDKFDTLSEVETFIETVFDDNERDGIALMTVHKAKGLESDRVFFIEKYEGKKLIPSQYAVTKEQLIQESNLSFVCLTRAKNEFVYLEL